MTTEEQTNNKGNNINGIDLSSPANGAKSLGKLGYNVFRIERAGTEYESYDRKTKKPIIKKADGKSAEASGKWEGWKEKKQNERNVSILFDNRPDCNIAVVQGEMSGDKDHGAFTLDEDGSCMEIAEEAIITLNEELAQKLRETPTSLTPHGRHRFLLYSKAEFKGGLKTETIISLGENREHREIKIIGQGGYTVEPPSIGIDGNYTMLNNDFTKIAKLTKKEIQEYKDAILRVKREQEPEHKLTWAEADTAEETNDTNVDNDKIEKLIEIGKGLYQKGSRHDFVLPFASFMRRYIKMNKEDVHQVIESLHPTDIKNRDTVEDAYSKPMNKIANRLTLKEIIKKIVNDDRKANNLMNELLSLAPPDINKKHGRTKQFDEEQEQDPAALLLDLAQRNTELCFKDKTRMNIML